MNGESHNQSGQAGQPQRTHSTRLVSHYPDRSEGPRSDRGARDAAQSARAALSIVATATIQYCIPAPLQPLYIAGSELGTSGSLAALHLAASAIASHAAPISRLLLAG